MSFRQAFGLAASVCLVTLLVGSSLIVSSPAMAQSSSGGPPGQQVIDPVNLAQNGQPYILRGDPLNEPRKCRCRPYQQHKGQRNAHCHQNGGKGVEDRTYRRIEKRAQN